MWKQTALPTTSLALPKPFPKGLQARSRLWLAAGVWATQNLALRAEAPHGQGSQEDQESRGISCLDIELRDVSKARVIWVTFSVEVNGCSFCYSYPQQVAYDFESVSEQFLSPLRNPGLGRLSSRRVNRPTWRKARCTQTLIRGSSG